MVSMGAITIELLYFTLAYFSFSFIENYLSSFSIILKIVGITYLLYLAYQIFQKAKIIPAETAIENTNQNTTKSLLKDYGIGIFVTLANPLVILFYTALIPTVLDLSEINLKGLFTALTIIFMVHFVILTSQCALATQLRIFLKDKVSIQRLNHTSAILLIFVALYILWGFKNLL